MIKTLCIGNASYDISVVVDEHLIEGSSNRFIEKIGCGSGTANNAAYLLAKWGVNTTFAGVIGNDQFGGRIKSELESVKVDTRYIESSFEKDTVINFVVVNRKNLEKTIVTVADEFGKLKKHDYDFTPDLLLTDGEDPYAFKTAMQKFPKAVTVMAFKRAIKSDFELSRLVTHVICSLEVAEAVSGVKVDFNNPDSLATMYYKVKTKFNKDVVVTLGSHGTLYVVNNQIKVSPALGFKAVDTNAAGDVFVGAYAFTLLRGGDIAKAVKFANIAAGLSTLKIGIKNSIPSLDEVEKYYGQNYE